MVQGRKCFGRTAEASSRDGNQKERFDQSSFVYIEDVRHR